VLQSWSKATVFGEAEAMQYLGLHGHLPTIT
jgi:hypothetical protein